MQADRDEVASLNHWTPQKVETYLNVARMEMSGRMLRQMPPDENFNIRVVQMTPELQQEIYHHRLSYHIWQGYIVIEWIGDMNRRQRASANTEMEELRYLLSYDYEAAIRALAEQAQLQGRGNPKSYRSKSR